MIKVVRYTIYKTKEYEKWILRENEKSKAQIAQRVAAIQWDGYFGDAKNIGNGVFELRWKNGRRVYYEIIPEKNLILLLGGYKNDQKKDIAFVKKISKKYTVEKD
jgi:putative addiction module killer protein